MRAISEVTLEDCRWVMADWRSALPRARPLMTDRIGRMIDGAVIERQRIDALLRTRWTWLDANRSHPRYAEGEAVVIELLEQYEDWCNAVEGMCDAIGDERERCHG